MRIGLLIYGSLDILTGGYLYDRRIVEEWRSRGDDVVLITLPYRSYWKHLGDNLSSTLLRQLREERLDVLIQDELNHPSLVWINRRLHSHISFPLISLIHLLRSSEHRPAYQNAFYRLIEASYLRSVDAHIYNSRDTQQRVRALIGGDKPGIIAYPGRDHVPAATIADETTGPRPRPFRLITVGNVVPRKGLHTLLDALSRQANDQWILQVIGDLQMDRGYVAQIRRQIDQLGLQHQVQFLGRVPNSQVPAYLATADLFVLVSQYEAFGIVYLEAAAAGLPIVASTSGAANEIVRHNQEGWLVPADDPQRLAETVTRAMQRPDVLLRMGQAARVRCEAFPTWAETAATIRDFLSTVRIRQ